MRWTLKLRTCTIRCASYGSAINNFFSSVNDPFPVLPNFPQNGQLGLGRRYGAEIRIILKLGTCIFGCATEGTSSNDFSISVKDHLPDLPHFFPKLITWSMNTLPRKDKVHIDKTQSRNTLRGWDKDHIEAWHLNMQGRYRRYLYQQF